jgi:hypothetical protein
MAVAVLTQVLSLIAACSNHRHPNNKITDRIPVHSSSRRSAFSALSLDRLYGAIFAKGHTAFISLAVAVGNCNRLTK